MGSLYKRVLSSGILIFFTFASSMELQAGWYSCVARASSHTGYYMFKIEKRPCAVYWLELRRWLTLQSCNLPEIVAIKPSARDSLSVVRFNLKSGYFSDYLSGVIDRGTCRKIPSARKPAQP